MSDIETNIPGRPDKRHLIYSYWIASTGIMDVFRALFRSYYVTDQILKLNKKEDSMLIDRLKLVMDNVYPVPTNSIQPTPVQLLGNACYRLFGLKIKGIEDFPKAENINTEFYSTFEDVLYQIAQSILDKNITIERLGNAYTQADLLNNLKAQLLNRTYNSIEDVAYFFAIQLQELLTLLDEDDLTVKRLNIRSVGRENRLVELGEKLKVPVAKKPRPIFGLAEKMDVLLETIEDTEWDASSAAKLYELPNDETFFKEFYNDWFQVTGRDIFGDALKARRRA